MIETETVVRKEEEEEEEGDKDGIGKRRTQRRDEQIKLMRLRQRKPKRGIRPDDSAAISSV